MAGSIDLCRAGGLATVTLSNPGKRNALDVPMWTRLRRVFEDLSADDALRCVLIRGDGTDAFAAGADISEFETARRTLDQVTHYHEVLVPGALRAIRRCPVPVVAAIRGACVGGGLEIAAMCDIRVAATSARFGAPVARLGFPLAHGEMAPVVEAFGTTLVAELLFEARLADAAEAAARGLVGRVVPDAELEATVAAVVERILSCAPLATRRHKVQLLRLAGHAADAPEERHDAYAFVDSDDYAIGVRSFLNKTPPVFTGR